MTRYFTREEAEALLPQISVILGNMRREYTMMKEFEQELAELETRTKSNGHHLHDRIATLQQTLSSRLQAVRTLAAELAELGCELKDPGQGLVDFRALREGREVYLCWRLGEERINYWHELDGGFAGRQPF